MSFQIKIADRNIEISANYYGRVLELCRNYSDSTAEPDLVIHVTEAEVDTECENAAEIDENGAKKYPNLLRGDIVSLAVYRKISVAMLDYSTFLMHGSIIATGSDAFMFTAKSGVGKTTRSNLWLEQIPGSYFVNGDKPLLKVQENDVLACGTPWSGKENLNTNTMVPLRAIFLLERADETSLQQLSFTEAFSMLLQQTYRPSDPQLMVKTIRLLKQLDGRVKFYRYRSSLDDADMRMLYRTVMNQEPPAEIGT